MAIKQVGNLDPDTIKVVQAVRVQLIELPDGSTRHALSNPGGLAFDVVITLLEQGLRIAYKLRDSGVEPKLAPNTVIEYCLE